MRHTKRPWGEVVAVENWAIHTSLSVAAKGRECPAWGLSRWDLPGSTQTQEADIKADSTHPGPLVDAYGIMVAEQTREVVQMTAMTEEIALRFCEVCSWAYESWITHKTLFDNNEAPESNIGKSADFTYRLSTITQEYTLQQIAKLHDRATLNNSKNLSINYIVEFGEWKEKQEEIEGIVRRLDALKDRIIRARNKILSHNDLETILANVPLGGFPVDADREYFEALQELASEVHDRWIGGPYILPDFAEVDAKNFLTLLERAE